MSDTTYFDTKAGEWDTPERTALADAVAEAIIQHVPLNKTMTAMDYGAGTGLVSLRLCGLVGKIIAADTSPEMLEVLKKKLRASNAGTIETRVFDITREQTPESGYDLVFSSMTLHHLEDTAAAVKAFYRLVAPEGFFALADLDTEEGDFHSADAGAKHHGFDREELAGICRDSGFTSVETHTAYRFFKATSGGKKKEFSIFILTAGK